MCNFLNIKLFYCHSNDSTGQCFGVVNNAATGHCLCITDSGNRTAGLEKIIDPCCSTCVTRNSCESFDSRES